MEVLLKKYLWKFVLVYIHDIIVYMRPHEAITPPEDPD